MERRTLSDEKPIALVLENSDTSHGGRRARAGRKKQPYGRCPCGEFTIRTAYLRKHICPPENIQRELVFMIGDQVRAWRALMRHTTNYVAERSGIPLATVEALESRENPISAASLTLADIERITSAMQCCVTAFRIGEVAVPEAQMAKPKRAKQPTRLDELFAQFPETE